MSSFYTKFIKESKKGYTLRGGPLAKWRYPLSRVLYRKRIAAGPEPERPRSVWSNWNYNSEIYAFMSRLNEQFNENLLRQAFIDPSYTIAEKAKLKDLGVEFSNQTIENNLRLAQDGERICKFYLRALFNFWYPSLPDEGVETVVSYLLNTENVSMIAKNIGVYDLVKSEEFPINNEILQSVLYAVVAALSESSGQIRAHLFINDFILTQMIGKDINEIWKIKNPMGLLCAQLEKKGHKSLPKARLLWSTGANTPTSAFIVGLYIDEKFLSKGSGETLDVAEEMAARDALRRMFGTGEEASPIPMGEKARKFSQIINGHYEKLIKKEFKI